MPATPPIFSPISDLPLVEGTFLSRPNRFSALCGINGMETHVFMPNPGRMGELLLPGAELILADHGRQENRKTRYTVMAVCYGERIVFLHTHLNNVAACKLIEAGAIPALKECKVVGSEVTAGKHRFDFLLRDDEAERYLEVKSCTLSANGIAMFPDAVTERGRRHLLALAQMNRQGQSSALLFVIHHGNARVFLPDYHTDFAFSRAFCDVENKLPIYAVALKWTRDLRFRISNPQVTIPWDTIRAEAVDRGHLVCVEQDGPGFRITLTGYVESLARKAARRTGRIYPVRTSIDESVRMVAVLSNLFGEPVQDGDCWCFESETDPVPTPEFQRALLDFRMPCRLLEPP